MTRSFIASIESELRPIGQCVGQRLPVSACGASPAFLG
jgi:hypothetical protein